SFCFILFYDPSALCHLLTHLLPLCPPPSITLLLSNHPATPDIYTLSLHDALPIWPNILILYHGDAQSLILQCAILTLNFWSFLIDRKSTRLNSSHVSISYAVFCLKKKKCHGDR